MIPLFLHYSPTILKRIYSDFVWHIPTSQKIIYLTFDDGPIPEVTEWVLDQLKAYHAKATFFCIGDNVQKHPEIFKKLRAEGHSIGNHTFNHLKGWSTPDEYYHQNVAQCQALLPPTTLFRPPYGRIKMSQAKLLLPQYQIVMWDVLTGDFEQYLSPERCLQKTLQHIRNGSIVVLHDSLKAWRNMSYVLPRLLEHYAEQGYRFQALPQQVSASQKLSKMSI
ncbi:MAG: polysaccharide deacetylase family protein [Runella sp.]